MEEIRFKVERITLAKYGLAFEFSNRERRVGITLGWNGFLRLTRPADSVLGEEFRDFLEVFLEFENVQSFSMSGSSADESQIFEADEELSSGVFMDRSQRYGVPPTDFYYLAKACADVARIAKVKPTEIFQLVGRSGVSVTLYGKLNIFTLQFETALSRILLFAQALNDLPDDEPEFLFAGPSQALMWDHVVQQILARENCLERHLHDVDPDPAA